MCKHCVPIRSMSIYNIKSAYVPCGDCADCRKKNQSDWTTRIKSELEYYHFKRKFNVGFITLTYNNIHLPHIPRRFFKRGAYRRVPCFSYPDIKRFTDGIRNYLFREHGLTDGYRFFLSSEYGEKHHRPHYHMILLFHPSISHRVMYDVCSDLWCGTERVIPNNPKHKRKRRHFGIISDFEGDKGFIPRDNYSVGSYVAKYVCKDIEFTDTVGDSFSHLSKRQKNHLRWFMPFHKQSRAFGACLLAGKSDEQCLNYLLHGVPFVGTRALAPLPRYLKDKLLYTYMKRYNLHSHSEETIKKYSSFFLRHRDVIYSYKLDCMREKLRELSDSAFWKLHPFSDGVYKDFSSWISECISVLGLDNLANFAVAYHGLRYNFCHDVPYISDFYFSRYDPIADWSDWPLIDRRFYAVYTRALNQIFAFESCTSIPKRSELDKVISQVRAFHQNLCK